MPAERCGLQVHIDTRGSTDGPPHRRSQTAVLTVQGRCEGRQLHTAVWRDQIQPTGTAAHETRQLRYTTGALLRDSAGCWQRQQQPQGAALSMATREAALPLQGGERTPEAAASRPPQEREQPVQLAYRLPLIRKHRIWTSKAVTELKGSMSDSLVL